MTTTLQVRVDSKVKSQAQKAFMAMGLDLSSGIKLYLTQVAHAQAIPFAVMTAEQFSKEKKQRLASETAAALKTGKSYTSAKLAHKAIR